MAEKKTGHENLIPLNKRSKEEQRIVQAAGGRKSGEVRRKKKFLRETLEMMLSEKISPDVELQIESILKSPLKSKTVQDAVVAGLITRVIERGDPQAFRAIRDAIGEKGFDNQKDSGVQIIDDIPIE